MDLSNLLRDLKEVEINANPHAILSKLTDFNKKNSDKFECQKSSAEIRSELIGILFKLAKEYDNKLNDHAAEHYVALALKEVLICIKILSRAKELAFTIGNGGEFVDELTERANIRNGRDGDALNGSDGEKQIQTLTILKEAELEAVKIICNCVFHCQEFRRHFSKSRHSKLVTKRLGEFGPRLNTEKEICSMLIKVLFLMSALDINEREKMRTEYKTDEVLIAILAAVLKTVEGAIEQESSASTQKMLDQKVDASVTLVIEVLKALFNVTVNVADASVIEEQACKNYCTLSCLLQEYLVHPHFASVLPKALVGHIANMLINIPKGCLQGLLPSVKRRPWQEQVPKFKGYPCEYELKDVSAVIVLIACLDEELKLKAPANDDESHIFSILSCLCHICRCLRLARKYLRIQILPPLKDATVRPEMDESLKGRLVKLMTNPNTNVKNMAADFLFVLCKEDPDRLVKHTGYGNAVGLLAGRGLMGRTSANRTGDYSSDDDDSETEEYSAIAKDIDPITGAISSKSKESDPFQGMSEEEKEASAQELMSLLDKMSSLDMIKPMRIGESGRPEVFNVEEAKELVKEQLNKEK